MAGAQHIFKAMADPTRQKILQVLARTELVVSELVEVLNLPQSTVSRHLKILRDAILVRTRNRGAATAYSQAAGPETNGDNLRAQMLGWAAREPFPNVLATRLDEVVRRRRSESDAFFAGVVDRWDQMRVTCFGASFHLEALAAVLPSEWTVADVGAGTGYLLPALAVGFRRVIAVDPVEEMLQACRHRMDGSANVEFHRGSATAMPIETATIDLLIASLVLHHEPKPTDALVEFGRVLKPGGTLLIVEAAAHSFEQFHEMMQDRWWGFEASELCQDVTHAGFSDVLSRRLTTAAASSGSAPEAPELFVVTGRRRNEEQD